MSKVYETAYLRSGKVARLGRTAYQPPIVTATGSPVIVTATAAVAAASRPTGPDYIRWEDLALPGDDLQTGLNRLTTPKVVTFPEGEFKFRGFNTGFQAGITLPPVCRGIVGSGPGTLGGTSGTIFTIEPNSSTSAAQATVPVGTPTQLNMVKHYPTGAATVEGGFTSVYRNFQLRGTAQGHVYHAWQTYATPGKVLFEDVLVTGWEGNDGRPPGETFGIQVNGVGAHVFRRVVADGRRTPGGQAFGGAGFTFQKCVGATFENCVAWYCRVASFVFYDSYNCTLTDCTADSNSAGAYGIGNGGINLEAFDGIKLIRPTIVGRPGKVHITASGDQGTLTRNGVTYSAASGTLEVIDPVIPVNGRISPSDARLVIQTWDPYSRGSDTVGVSTYAYPQDAPKVHTAAGATIPYVWILAGVHYSMT